MSALRIALTLNLKSSGKRKFDSYSVAPTRDLMCRSYMCTCPAAPLPGALPVAIPRVLFKVAGGDSEAGTAVHAAACQCAGPARRMVTVTVTSSGTRHSSKLKVLRVRDPRKLASDWQVGRSVQSNSIDIMIGLTAE